MDHGRSGYVTGCRCEICTAANRRYQRNRYRRLHRPDATPPAAMVDAAPTRRRLLHLLSLGWPLTHIAQVAATARSTLQDIATGRTSRTHADVHTRVVHAYRSLLSRRPRRAPQR